jgi:hypothetical protein
VSVNKQKSTHNHHTLFLHNTDSQKSCRISAENYFFGTVILFLLSNLPYILWTSVSSIPFSHRHYPPFSTVASGYSRYSRILTSNCNFSPAGRSCTSHLKRYKIFKKQIENRSIKTMKSTYLHHKTLKMLSL